MKKDRFLRCFLTLLLAAVLLAGCAGRAAPEAPTLNETLPTAPAPTEAPVPTEPPAELALLEELENEVVEDMFCGDGRALALTSLDGKEPMLRLYDLQTGGEAARYAVDDPLTLSWFTADGNVAAVSCGTGTVRVFDSEMQTVLWSSELGEGCILGADRVTDAVWYRKEGEPQAHAFRMELTDASVREYELPDGELHLRCYSREQAILMTYDSESWDPSYYALSLEDGTLTPADSMENLQELSQGRLIRQTEAMTCWYDDFGGESWHFLDLDRNHVLQAAGGETLAGYDARQDGMFLCRVDTGAYWDVPMTGGAADCAVSDDWALFAMQTDEGRFSLYVWNFTGAPASAAVSSEMLSRAELEERIQSACGQIQQDTGMTVFYGARGTAFNENSPSGYEGDQVDDPLLIWDAVRILREWIQEYPQGVFREIPCAGVTGIDIYFCGRLLPAGEDSISAAAAFTLDSGERRIVVLDLRDTYYLRRNLAHEFMHAMEDRILEKEIEDGLPYLSYWEALSPEDGYQYSYFDGDGNEVYSLEYTTLADNARDNPDGVWFVDAYSRTLPTEDRARVLEYLYDPDLRQTIHDYPHLTAKARYLCALIRHCFPSCADGALPWETGLATCPLADYLPQLKTWEPVPKG